MDKSIQDVTLDKIGDDRLELSVIFTDPRSLTKYISEPDILEVYILLP